MKKRKNICIAIAVLMLIAIATICISAEDTSLELTVGSVETVKNEEALISHGLQVIAAQKPMVIAGLRGNVLNFSEERFACAMNLSSVEYITVTKLPNVSCGSLYIGSEGVSEGQTVKASDIALMTYEEASAGVGGEASFEFTVNDSTYEMTCNIIMIDTVNYSPTVSLASPASLNVETYRNVLVTGALSAYDPEGDAMVYEIVKYPENGRLSLDNQTLGTYTYVPDEAYTGEDSFCYVVRDIYGNYSASEEVKIHVATQGCATVYSDLLDHALHSSAIAMTECGVMNGVQVGDYYYFEADRSVSRAEFLVTAMSAIGIKNLPEVSTTVFADDREISDEMKGYVSLAYSKGYISGIKVGGDLYFKPDEPIKLSEAAVIISNMIGYAEPKVVPVFADAERIPAWSEKAIKSLHALGILETPDMNSGAEKEITRGDMAKLLQKTMFVIGK